MSHVKMTFVATDIETTGLSKRYDSIISIGAVKVVDNVVVDKFYRIIRTTKKFTPFSDNIARLAEESLVSGIDYDQALTEYMEFLGECNFVAHNAHFDHGFIDTKVRKKLGMSLPYHKHCTIDLTKKLWKKLPKYDLNTIAQSMGISNLNHHNALNDAEVCCDILLVLNGCEPQATVRPNNPNRDLLSEMMKSNGFK